MGALATFLEKYGKKAGLVGEKGLKAGKEMGGDVMSKIAELIGEHPKKSAALAGIGGIAAGRESKEGPDDMDIDELLNAAHKRHEEDEEEI
jgi:hypothetical protein